KLFGNTELSLRLPTLFGYLLYLGGGVWLLMRLQNVWLSIAGFLLLNLNPFLLDFFFLSRGYGLALGFLMLSLALFTNAYLHKTKPDFILYLFGSAAAGGLAVLANFAFLDFYAPLLAACVWLLVTDESLRRFSINHWRAGLIFLVANGAYLGF